jgi:hypothetical protein
MSSFSVADDPISGVVCTSVAATLPVDRLHPFSGEQVPIVSLAAMAIFFFRYPKILDTEDDDQVSKQQVVTFW